MSVFLDDRPFTTGLTDRSTVAELIDSARRSLDGTGRLLIGLRCDQAEVSPAQLDSLLGQPVALFARLDLLSDNPARLVLDILEDARRSLAESFTTLHEAADKLSAGACAEALDGLVTCIQSWGQVQDAIIKGGQLLQIRFEGVVIQGRTVQDWLDRLIKGLREVKNAVEANDLVLLADMLRYELDEIIQEWEAFVCGFVDYVRQHYAANDARAVVP